MTYLTYFDCGPSAKLNGFRDYLLLVLDGKKEVWATCIGRPDKVEWFVSQRLGSALYPEGRWEAPTCKRGGVVIAPDCVDPLLLSKLRGQSELGL